MNIKISQFRHAFVEFVPERIDNGVIYISTQYATAVHLCACGCGHEVVTPLSPTDWKLIFDGVSISLTPSIGNWSFPCKSHYWIKRNSVDWATVWSQEQIDIGRQHDYEIKGRYFATPAILEPKKKHSGRGLWAKITNWWS